jgi:hypothetical protein
MPALESVDDLAQLKQITELTESRCVDDVVRARRCLDVVMIYPIGPGRRNEGSTAVWQDDEDKQHAASLNAADHRQRLPLERMALANDRHIIRMIAEMGSVSPLPSTRSRTIACERSSTSE